MVYTESNSKGFPSTGVMRWLCPPQSSRRRICRPRLGGKGQALIFLAHLEGKMGCTCWHSPCQILMHVAEQANETHGELSSHPGNFNAAIRLPATKRAKTPAAIRPPQIKIRITIAAVIGHSQPTPVECTGRRSSRRRVHSLAESEKFLGMHALNRVSCAYIHRPASWPPQLLDVFLQSSHLALQLSPRRCLSPQQHDQSTVLFHRDRVGIVHRRSN